MFTTVVVGIAHMGEMRDVGRIGPFARSSRLRSCRRCLVIGLIVVTVLKRGQASASPGDGRCKSVASYDRVVTPGARSTSSNVSRHHRRRLRARRCYSAAVLGAVRTCPAAAPGPRVHRLVEIIEDDVGRVVRRRGPSSCVWRRSVPSARWRSPWAGKLRPRVARGAGQADGGRLHHLRGLRLHRPRCDRARHGFQ